MKGSSSKGEEEKKIQLFHIKVQTKHTKIDALFDPGSQVNLISELLVRKLELETYPHLKPYPLGWVSNLTMMQVIRKCKLNFAMNVDYIDEVELDIVPLNVAGIVLGSIYLIRTLFITGEKIDTNLLSMVDHLL